MYNVGITGTGSLIGQGIIKSIKNSIHASEYNLIGLDYFKETVGSFWCSTYYILPDLLKETVTKEEWLAEVKRIILIERLDILFVGVDFELPLFANHSNSLELATGCKIMVSSENVINVGNDKYLTYQFLKENNLNYPRTFLPAEEFDKELDFPVIVKPRVGARSVGVYLVKNKQELNEKLATVNSPIIQEYVGGDDTEYTCGVICLENEVKAQISLIRTLKGGHTHISQYSNEIPPNIDKYVRNIASKLMPYGSCNFQLRVDDKGVPKLFEINPRHSGTTYMRSLFGYNEVIFILKYVLEGKTIRFSLKNGKAMRYYEEVLL